jgi:hypothetical protein
VLADDPQVRAFGLPARRAGRALAARHEGVDDNSVAGREPAGAGADLGHLTRAFGPEHDRHLRRGEPALAHEHVDPVEPGGAQRDQHLPGPGRAVANTNPFDPAVTASSGDVWAETVNPNATYTPITLTAGQTGASREPCSRAARACGHAGYGGPCPDR